MNEWAGAAGKLDLGAYLRRVGYAGPRRPTEETLRALHHRHLAAIPFENLDIILGRGVAVDLESVQAKLVDGGRGGYCFEHGQLFAAALERTGFTVERLLARVSRPGPVLPRTHLTLRVSTPDRSGTWLADVGFASSPPEPLALRPLRPGGSQDLGGWTYEVAPDDEEGRTWALRELQGREWVTLYRFEDSPVFPADVVMGNHYTSTHPDSWFTRTPVVARRTPDAVTSLLGRVLTVTRPGHVKERRELDDEEWAAALAGVFGLEFAPGERAALLASADGV
ncbi:MAG: arylamine N-acetyltransferase [Streptosporangiales bacterium]|nr:arylamine N-acetyltransferase [Streptosporangiales bacterium]